MEVLLILIMLYLSIGLLFLMALNRVAPKVWERIVNSPYELFNRLSEKGTYSSLKTIKLIMYPACWLGWIFILIGMVQGRHERRKQ